MVFSGKEKKESDWALSVLRAFTKRGSVSVDSIIGFCFLLRARSRKAFFQIRSSSSSHIKSMTISRSRLNSLLCYFSTTMASKPETIYFGPYEVTDQVFYHSTSCYGLTNIKPVLPGHVLVVPFRPVQRVTDLTAAEVTDFFTTVQKVQKMLAGHYFQANGLSGQPEDGSFNIAIQDGKEAGQTVPHLHCHIIPRTRDDKIGDEVYLKLESEEGNVGGGFHDMKRPKQRGKFPQIEGMKKEPRSLDRMKEEAAIFREMMKLLENE